MEIIKLDPQNVKPIANHLILCLGYFDGLHLGHQKVVKSATANHLDPVAVVTFSRAPGFLSKKHKNEMILMSNDTKAAILEKMGVDYLLVLEADEKLMNMTADQFIIKVLTKLKPVLICCGPDYRFGHLRIGDVSLLKRYFKVNVVGEVDNDNVKISSTKIIHYLLEGNVEVAALLLGREYQLEGKVVKGRQVGRAIGYPTANIELSQPFAIPKNGVYIGSIEFDHQVYPCLINVGVRPTFGEHGNLSIEAYIPGLEKSIYNQPVKLSFTKFLREEKEFPNVEELKEQITLDLELIETK